MPSASALKQKQEIVSGLAEKLRSATSSVIVDYKGITVEQDTALRSALRAEGVEYTVVKNTLLRFAAKEAGLEDLAQYLEGTTAIATTTGDAIAPAKILSKYAADSKDKYTLKAGVFEGKVVDSATITAIGKLPSKEVLISQVLFGFNAPIAAFARVIDAIAKKQSA